VYADTSERDIFFIFHDALSAWWEVEAQQHMEMLGFKDRQIRCLGATNCDNRYRGKLVGNSPELCRALDSHGFSDLRSSLMFHCNLSTFLPPEDPRRFSMGTPESIWSAMTRCWEVAPTSERIVQDIMYLPEVVDKIIEYKGCMVPEKCLRHGQPR
jgi:hypothetical protein